MCAHSGLTHRPIFTPSYGNYRQGIILQIPLPLWSLRDAVGGGELHRALAAYYEGSAFVTVAPMTEVEGVEKLDPEALNGTNSVKLYVFANNKYRQAVLTAVYDNLGKGAS